MSIAAKIKPPAHEGDDDLDRLLGDKMLFDLGSRRRMAAQCADALSSQARRPLRCRQKRQPVDAHPSDDEEDSDRGPRPDPLEGHLTKRPPNA